MYCLQWLIPVLLLPKPVRSKQWYLNVFFYFFFQVNPALLYNHIMFIVLYLTGFFLEKKPCTICSIVSQMFAHQFIVKCLPIWGIYRGDGVNLLLWLWLLSVLELLSAAGDVRPSYRQKTFQVFVLQDVEYSCQPRQDQHWDCLLLISDSGSVTRLWDRQHPPGSSYSSTWHVNINTDKLYYNDTTTHLHWAWCDSSLHTFVIHPDTTIIFHYIIYCTFWE